MKGYRALWAEPQAPDYGWPDSVAQTLLFTQLVTADIHVRKQALSRGWNVVPIWVV